jgi:Uma2 family endonuclease
MAMPNVHRYTVQDLLHFPDDGTRYELIDGELVVSPRPALPHEKVVHRLFVALHDYLRPLGRGETVFMAGAVSWDEETFVIPDLYVSVPEELTADWNSVKTLLLAVEVMSPGSRRRDRVLKRDVYQRNEVREYWVVDPRERLVEVWRPEETEAGVVADVLRWRLGPDAPPLGIPLAPLFRGLPG